MTLAELAVTVALLGLLGLVARRFGLSAIPAYLLAGLLLGPNEPQGAGARSARRRSRSSSPSSASSSCCSSSGSSSRSPGCARPGGTSALGGAVDFVVNAGLGLVVGVAAFGVSFAALILAAAVYVSSSAIAVKGLIDFRRLADDETDLVLAILVFEDLAIALMLGFAAGGGGERFGTLVLVAKALGFITRLARGLALAESADRPAARPAAARVLPAAGVRVPRRDERRVAEELGLSEAIGALMAGVVLSETSVREEIEERFFSFRDIFAALFFFVFGLSIDLGAIGEVGWIVALAVVRPLVGKIGGGVARRASSAASRARQSFNAGVALVAHGEFTIILAQIACDNDGALRRRPARPRRVRRPLRPRDRDDRHRADEGVESDSAAFSSRP